MILMMMMMMMMNDSDSQRLEKAINLMMIYWDEYLTIYERRCYMPIYLFHVDNLCHCTILLHPLFLCLHY